VRGRRAASARRGSTLIEVLLSLAIMALVMVGILQMFSIALVVNRGAAARTHMLFRCQQVIENLRYYYFLARAGRPTPDPATKPTGGDVTGIPWPFPASSTTYDLPYDATDANYTYWGPTGANVIERAKGPYKLSYTIYQQDPADDDRNAGLYIIRVTAVPTDAADASERYFGIGPRNAKRIDYVAEF